VLVVDGGPTSSPSTAGLLAAVQDAGEVVLLPNDANVLAVATAAADLLRLEGRSAAVVPSRSVVQGLAAACVSDPGRAFDDDVATMAAAAGATRWAEVTTAVRAADTAAGRCRAGDVLGLLEGSVALVGRDLGEVGQELLRRLLEAGGELVTVVLGSGSDAGLGGRLEAWMSQVHPRVEVVVLRGDQPHYPLLLGVE
jgi:dihydroxyacetone kinase-like predicted kinase